MLRSIVDRRGWWLVAGLVAGLAVGHFWTSSQVARQRDPSQVEALLGRLFPATPVHAVATDRYENFAIATGPLDNDVEAVYFLDFATGDLTGAVLSVQTGAFSAFYRYNILNDFGVDASKSPRFLMVTGVADIRRGGTRWRPGRSVIYIAELTTGRVAAYGVPWMPETHKRGQPFMGEFIPLDIAPFRTTEIRQQ